MEHGTVVMKKHKKRKKKGMKSDHQEQVRARPASLPPETAEHHCPFCGMDASDPTLNRFGEYFCSEAHVAEYARAVRARAEEGAGQPAQHVAQEGEVQLKTGGLSSLLKLGACCAAPILALAILLPLVQGGATGLTAIAGNLLYFAALLACPLGMYFMMRSMHRTQHGEEGEGHEKSGDPKALPRDRENP